MHQACSAPTFRCCWSTRDGPAGSVGDARPTTSPRGGPQRVHAPRRVPDPLTVVGSAGRGSGRLPFTAGGPDRRTMFEDRRRRRVGPDRFVLAPGPARTRRLRYHPSIGVEYRRTRPSRASPRAVVALLDQCRRRACRGSSALAPVGSPSLTIAALHPDRVSAIGVIDIGHRSKTKVRSLASSSSCSATTRFGVARDAAAADRGVPPGPQTAVARRLTPTCASVPTAGRAWKHALGPVDCATRMRQILTTGPATGADSEGMDAELTQPDLSVLVLRLRAATVLFRNEGAQEVAAAHPERQHRNDQRCRSPRRG